MRIKDNRWRTDPALWERLKPIAHEKRNEPTEAEKELWAHLHRRSLQGLIFRRQHSIGPFIVDFYCYKAKLVIEVDGEIHQYQPEEDRIRQEFLESLKLNILRFSNYNVLNNTDKVILQIRDYLTSTI